MDDVRATITELYDRAFLMTGSRREAYTRVKSTISTAALAGSGLGLVALTGIVARAVAKNGTAQRSSSLLDDLLRRDVADPRRASNMEAPIDALAGDARRTCLAFVLGCLAPQLRVVFVLTDVCEYAPAQAAALLEISEGACRVRLARARRGVDEFVLPGRRCSCSGTTR
ncbi:MAG: sigma-70 region 4 domain-containing protein [Myxococcales bacterium]|nr:sigma-70 region 4 domain-containing protein [Myxococcales bacterium]